jgi:hypothetical protein
MLAIPATVVWPPRERKDGRLINSVIMTCPDFSQVWTCDPKQFLANL